MKYLLTLGLLLFCFNTTGGDFDVDELEKQQSIECLARNMYYEARGEPKKGIIAVGYTTMNRTKAKNFPSDVCDVVHQKSVNQKYCAFSWVCMKSLPKIKDELYDQIRSLAEAVYDGAISDPTKGATHFHNNTVAPVWAGNKQVTAVIGNHIFYRK